MTAGARDDIFETLDSMKKLELIFLQMGTSAYAYLRINRIAVQHAERSVKIKGFHATDEGETGRGIYSGTVPGFMRNAAQISRRFFFCASFSFDISPSLSMIELKIRLW